MDVELMFNLGIDLRNRNKCEDAIAVFKKRISSGPELKIKVNVFIVMGWDLSRNRRS